MLVLCAAVGFSAKLSYDIVLYDVLIISVLLAGLARMAFCATLETLVGLASGS